MKKQNFISVWKVIALSLALPCLANGQISKSILFGTVDIERKTLSKMGSNYEQVDMKMAFRSQDIGKPDLPVYYYRFYVPKGQTVTGAVFKSNGISELQLSTDLIPAQHPKSISFKLLRI